MSKSVFQDSAWRRIKALVIKEYYQIIRDPSSILIGVLLPLILLFIYGFGVSLDLNHLRIGLVLEDTAPDAQSFAESLTASPYFDVFPVHDRRELVEAMTRGEIRGMVIIPSYFSQFLKRPNQIAPIQVITDGSEPNTASFVQNYVAGVWGIWMQQQALNGQALGRPLVSLDTRYWYNEKLGSRNFLLPGSLALIMTLIGTLLTALVVAREWERGTMEALMSTPVRISELLIGKLIPYFIFGMSSMTLCVLVALFFYDVPLRGSWVVLMFVSGVFLFSALGLGLLISSASKNQFVAAQVSQVAAFLPSFMLSGFIFEISSMPTIIQWFTYIIPARYFVSSLQTIFLVGDIWPLLIANLIPMFLIGLVYFGLSMRFNVKRLD